MSDKVIKQSVLLVVPVVSDIMPKLRPRELSCLKGENS